MLTAEQNVDPDGTVAQAGAGFQVAAGGAPITRMVWT